MTAIHFWFHAGEQSKPFWTGKSFNLLFSLCSTYPALHFMEILSWFLELFPYLNIFPPLKYEHSTTLHFHINPIFLFPQCEYSAVCHICWQLSLFWSTPTKSWTLFIHIIFEYLKISFKSLVLTYSKRKQIGLNQTDNLSWP